MYTRLRRAKYKDDPEAFTVAVYCEKHPLQLHRRRTRDGSQVQGHHELVPGYLICGPVTEQIAHQVRVLASTNIPVLISGETGVGKEGVARALHHLGIRRKKPYLTVCCPTVGTDVAASEFFGHKRGAFTDARQDTNGLFGDADTGSLFLDEIEALPGGVQGQLLRTLESGEVRPVGTSKTRVVDVRVITATNDDLDTLSRGGKFRKDLFYRLQGAEIHIPPLRERPEEIEPLTRHILAHVSTRALSLDTRVVHAFMHYPWPGNIRELRRVLEYVCLFTKGSHIQLEDIPPKVWKGTGKILVSVR